MKSLKKQFYDKFVISDTLDSKSVKRIMVADTDNVFKWFKSKLKEKAMSEEIEQIRKTYEDEIVRLHKLIAIKNEALRPCVGLLREYGRNCDKEINEGSEALGKTIEDMDKS
ncbi:MAG: hypothetical protein E2O29_01840 [Deltaproteobacteria bacterium]|nr:MAG: hypothetical protein E2O29_01840 [Deltaproteobacteria bacterium]